MTAPKPKPKPKPTPAGLILGVGAPEPPEPGPDDEPEAEPNPDVNDADNLRERIDAIFASQVALIERVDKLEERLTTPVGIGRRP